ncbi:ABC transporter substrate-binding protein [Xinfangfangia sp. D13-10-4-6]|uniref:ABC transporter substrate-binding protein n=1 Tax=Pseudogemmobacter hezensis TaxID=2737662 RepID=UPI0015572A02|nr:ABC transporter substrate-binding protein [Pseudogemmobacter hezensis]NPD14910.1 ABC transporter substrate-binding protein [Pseudogemmobacter hezensis]
MTSRRQFLAALPLSLGLSLAPARARGRKRIVMITFRGETEVERGFRDYLAAHGPETELIHRDLSRDISNLAAVIDEIRALAPDLIYTWGTPATLGVVGPWDQIDPARHITDIPVVFALVAAPVGAKISQSLQGSGRNVTGAVHVVPIAAQMRAMRGYRDFSRFGLLYSENEPNSRALLAELQAWAEGEQLSLRALPFHSAPDGSPDDKGLEDLVRDLAGSGAEWLYYLPDTFLGQHYSRVSAAALAARLPTFGAAELAIREGGALTGLISRYYSVGQLAGQKAVAILSEGADPGQLPIETLSRFSLIINMSVARALEVYPPLAMLDYAELI